MQGVYRIKTVFRTILRRYLFAFLTALPACTDGAKAIGDEAASA